MRLDGPLNYQRSEIVDGDLTCDHSCRGFWLVTHAPALMADHSARIFHARSPSQLRANGGTRTHTINLYVASD